MISLRRFLKNNRGQSLVEFAILAPLLLLFIGGMIEFGLVYHEQLVVTAAAREGARVAVVNSDNPTTAGKTAAENYAKNASISPAGVSASVSPVPPPGSSNRTVTVTVTNPIKIVVPVIDTLFKNKAGYDKNTGKFVVTGQAIMRVE